VATGEGVLAGSSLGMAAAAAATWPSLEWAESAPPESGVSLSLSAG